MILVEEVMEQRLQEKREDATHLLRVVSNDKWAATLLDASFGWLNRWGGKWVIRWVGISGKMP